jgi:ankyrin repeat protein
LVFILAAGEASEKLSDGGDLRGAAGGDWSAIPAERETERTATITGTAQLNKNCVVGFDFLFFWKMEGRKEAKEAKKKEEEDEDEDDEVLHIERNKQKVVDEEEQQELNEDFLDACYEEPLDEVKRLVEGGADLLYCDAYEGKNGLHLACQNKDFEAAEEIVKFLIKKCKALLEMVDDEQWSVLHHAAENSCAKICEILIENGCDVNAKTVLSSTPLTVCCCRADEEALKVAKLLIERGANVAKRDEDGVSALYWACYRGNVDLVQYLIDTKADVNAQDHRGQTPLMASVQNPLYGERIIPILVEAGADLTMTSERALKAVNYAFVFGGGKMLKALAPFVPKKYMDFQGRLPATNNADPIGSMTEGLQFGYSPEAGDFYRATKENVSSSPSFCWAMLRNGLFDIRVIFLALSALGDVVLWRYSTTELLQRGAGWSIDSGETILHVVVKCKKLSPEDKIEIVQHLLSFDINPLVLDGKNKRSAIEYCRKEEKEVYDILANYQKWKPQRKVMDWYGKRCRERLKTFLLVDKRLRLGLPRDLRHLILEYVAEKEEFDGDTANFSALHRTSNFNLWLDSSTELWQGARALDGYTGETILHSAVRSKLLSAEDKIKIVQHIMSFFINPFVLDNQNKRAIDYCTKEEKELNDLLVQYQQWRPEKKVMDWYGPYCRGRLEAFLLVEQRLKLGFPRHLNLLILSYVTEREYVWVPRK